MNHIIPKPLKYEEKAGMKLLSSNSTVFIDKELSENIQTVIRLFKAISVAIDINKVSDEASDNDIFDIYIFCDKNLGREEYAISCSARCINIYVSSNAGIIYALKTITQLRIVDKSTNHTLIPCCEIWDKPRFEHRGLHLDVARHFFTVKEVKTLLELMSLYKLNVLHLHLSDDQGWRIQIDKYPLLTQIGSFRAQSQEGAWGRAQMDSTPYSGFYTKDDIKKLIKFAENRNIMIIPEIDIPAHCAAAIASYGYLACEEKEAVVPTWFCDAGAKKCGYEHWNRPLCAGKESTYQFIFDVLDEICELFPAPYIHIGGDEAPKEEWAKCPSCKAKMEIENLKSLEELQGYFTNRIEDYIRQKGKTAIVWNDALNSNKIKSSVVCQYWTEGKDKRVLHHLKNNGKIIISKHEYLYFDMPYAKLPLMDTFYLSPTVFMIPPKYEKNILGIEGALWTEWIPTMEKLEFQLFPRLLALSEVAWKKKSNDNFSDFWQRWQIHKKLYLQTNNINYARDEISMPNGIMRLTSPDRIKSIVNKWETENSDVEFESNERIKKAKN